MSKKISFVCQDESVDLFVKLFTKLQGSQTDLKIRIGGSEYGFYKNIDAIGGLLVDDEDYATLSPVVITAYEVARKDALGTKGVVAASLSAHTAPANVVVADDSDADGEASCLDETSCLECGVYYFTSVLDSEGNCPACSDEDKVATTNLSDDDTTIVRDELAECVRMARIFTAFDVTKKVRKKGVQCKHNDVKEIVHNMFEVGGMGTYDRSLARIGSGAQPWLYCPDTRDPQDYNNGDN